MLDGDKHFTAVSSALLIMVLVFHAVAVRYDEATLLAEEKAASIYGTGTAGQIATLSSITQFYGMFVDVSVMIFIGFGFLMTFLRRYGYSAVGLNFLLSVFVFLWNVVCGGFWVNVNLGEPANFIQLGMPLMMEGLFGAAAVMISFGAVLGKTTPSQLMVMAFLEVIPYSFNLFLQLFVIKTNDAGGSLPIHAFGAYFGLTVALVLGNPKARPQQLSSVPSMTSAAAHAEHAPEDANGARTTSDLTAMIGTVFLFIFWPSFNAVMMPPGHQYRAVVNTFLSLAGCVMTTFIVSAHVSHGKFNMVHIQNATLAGGVAMGMCANWNFTPPGAIGVGIFAGALSTFGFARLMPLLNRKIGLDDTCGVHNLHGMPGIFACLVSFLPLVCNTAEANGLPAGVSVGLQVGRQFLGLACTLGLAIPTGWSVGMLLKAMPQPDYPTECYEDQPLWEVCRDYANLGDYPVQPSATVVGATKYAADVPDEPVVAVEGDHIDTEIAVSSDADAAATTHAGTA